MIAFNLLQLISGGDDEGDCGDEHHGEGEEGEELGEVAGQFFLFSTHIIKVKKHKL